MLYTTIYNEGLMQKVARVKKDKAPKGAKKVLDLISETPAQKYAPMISPEDAQKIREQLEARNAYAKSIMDANIARKAAEKTTQAIVPFEGSAPTMSQDMLKKMFEMSSGKPEKGIAEAAQRIAQRAQEAKGIAQEAQKATQVGKSLHGGFGTLIGSLLGGATNEGHRTSGAIGGGIGGTYGAMLSGIPKLGTPGKIVTGLVGATGLGYGGGKLGALIGRVLGGNS